MEVEEGFERMEEIAELEEGLEGLEKVEVFEECTDIGCASWMASLLLMLA